MPFKLPARLLHLNATGDASRRCPGLSGLFDGCPADEAIPIHLVREGDDLYHAVRTLDDGQVGGGDHESEADNGIAVLPIRNGLRQCPRIG